MEVDEDYNAISLKTVGNHEHLELFLGWLILRVSLSGHGNEADPSMWAKFIKLSTKVGKLPIVTSLFPVSSNSTTLQH